jgi:hypothetical protein
MAAIMTILRQYFDGHEGDSTDQSEAKNSSSTASGQASVTAGRDMDVSTIASAENVNIYRSPTSDTADFSNSAKNISSSISDPDQNQQDHNSSNPIYSAVEGGSVDQTYFTKIDDEFGLYPLTFKNQIQIGSSPTVFGGSVNEQIPASKFKQALASTAPYLTDPERCRFTISQAHGQWYGIGLQNYFDAIINPHQRYTRDYSFDAHSNEAAVCLAPIEKGGLLAIGSQPLNPLADHWSREYHPMRKLTVQFLTSGTPINPVRFNEIAECFAYQLDQGARDYGAYTAQVTANIRADIVETIEGPAQRFSTPNWVTHAVIPNPFRLRRGLLQDLNFKQAYDREQIDPEYQSRPRMIAAAPERVPIQLPGGASANCKGGGAIVHDIHVHVNTGLCIGMGHGNIDISGRVID